MSVILPIAALTAVFVLVLVLAFFSMGLRIIPSPLAIVTSLLAYVVAVAWIVRRSSKLVRKLEWLGLTDSLSGLPNRRALHRDFQALAANGEEAALAMVDLDGFKLVNDHYGHNVGDRMICECARLFTEMCGEEARVYRLGGDEFALMTVGPIAGNLLEGTCRGLLARLSKPLFVGDRAIVVGASIGLARRPEGGEVGSSELLRRTDVAMYASKRAGKMRCTWFSEDFDRQRECNRAIEDELRLALEHGEFCLHYQPLVDALTQEVVAVEALIRWERPDGQRIGPNEFIPVAEETGLINPIGLWVLRQGCTDALDWGSVKLSINVSSAQLRNPEFPIELGYLLEETGFPPERLELEVTETHLVLDSVIAGHSLDVIRDFGVRIVLDDFGTGYASIGFLRQFRFEKLKLDRSLVVDAATDNGSRAMMVASIAVARSLDMDVTAEGVETQDQADLVRMAGCDQIQGWLYFRPMPAQNIGMLLNERAGERLAGGAA